MNTIERRPIVAKFGGSSLANSERITAVKNIVESNPERKYVVVSAPGKDAANPTKVTDLLIARDMTPVRQRYMEIGTQLRLQQVNDWLGEVEAGVKANESDDWIKSRGEWLMAKTFADFIGGTFIDASRLIKLKENGQIDPSTYDLIKQKMDQEGRYVIPGFYGVGENGSVQCFKRGGSDITGAIIARGVDAKVYENWTDIDGVKVADPRVVRHPATIKELTHREMRELGYRGADVLQTDAVLPVLEKKIPINLRSSFEPEKPGTFIVFDRKSKEGEAVVGIAGKKGFVSFQIEKIGMNHEKGVARRVLEVFEENDVSFEHDPTGIDSMSIILHEDQLNEKSAKILLDLEANIHPDALSIIQNIGLICLVGQQISSKSTEIHRQIFETLEKAKIQLKGESYSIKGNNIIIAVDGQHMDDAIHAFYKTFNK